MKPMDLYLKQITRLYVGTHIWKKKIKLKWFTPLWERSKPYPSQAEVEKHKHEGAEGIELHNVLLLLLNVRATEAENQG